MKTYINIILASLMAASCVDTIILPDDKTVDEDFWKSKKDVALMVNGAYESMGYTDVIARLIVWGDMRSDEMVPTASGTSTGTREALQQISTANMETTNAFAQWNAFYHVINNCNIVLERSQGVMNEDPNYSEGDYLSDRAQMLALRSLCYFYLVRNFRDVPYSPGAFMNSSQDYNVPQSAPAYVLQRCIDDLEQAIPNAVAGNAYSDWRRVGYMTRDGMRSLLADIYLWRASVMHSQADYQKVIELCDQVIQAKKDQHIVRPYETQVKEYPLATQREMFYDLFVKQNAEESIFELQVNASNNVNSKNQRLGNNGVCQMLYKYDSNSSGFGFLKATSIFAGTASNGTKVYRQANDYRMNAFVFEANNTENGTYDVRKMVGDDVDLQPSATTGYTRNGARPWTGYAQNYIFYRLTDVILMKAEAMVQLATADDDPILRSAFNLVQAVNLRALDDNAQGDSIKWATYRESKETVELLVMEERLRELCFEGKRWYDLLRYNFRHVEGIDYNTTLAQQDEEGRQWVANYQAMLNLMGRKFDGGGSAVTNKMQGEPHLYLPIPHRELVVCPLLKQNPVYSESDEYEKNV
ncbi:MAG: RagB/SusD family nutrient uptake outer membrane protein [Prevotella sp.]|nr:RagB/SusD family nutrient uptake outer membrane protein [Prevotella sp.]